MPVSCDSALCAHLRKELGLNDQSRVPDDEIESEIERAKTELSNAIAYKAETGESFNFYGDEMAKTLTEYSKVRLSPLSPKTSNNGKGGKGGGVPPGQKVAARKVPPEHPKSVSQIRHTDFKDSQVNFWRDRMVHHFNRI